MFGAGVWQNAMTVDLIEHLVVLDILSDIYLLATKWPMTATDAPSDLEEECSTNRALW